MRPEPGGPQSAECAESGRAGFGCGTPGGARSVGLRWLTMRDAQGEGRAPVLQFTNCRILRGRALLRWGAGSGAAGVGPGAGRGAGCGAGSCWIGARGRVGCGDGSC